MKLFSNDLSKLSELITNGKVKAMLLYGPNQGLKEGIIKKIINQNNFFVSNQNGKDISPDSFLMLVNSQNLFANREIVKFNNIGNTINKELTSLLSEHSFANFICFIAEDTLPKTGIRKLFEEHPQLVAIGCYFEENLSKLIMQISKTRNCSISNEAFEYLSSNLHGDHLLIKAELEKIFSYSSTKGHVDLEDIKNSLSSDFNANSDKMCIFFARQEYGLFEKELSKLRQQNINDVLIIRALIRYFVNIYYATCYIEQGESADSAIKKLNSPIFYKYVADFKQIINKYNSQDAIKIISNLQEAEVKYKQNPNDFYLFWTSWQEI